ncbi:MAG: ATP-grasp domain-containing protein [Bacteroidetes bacterium]|nr:MAG: ATP-grasp domain-containing protein [Bacteroidota bacterium]
MIFVDRPYVSDFLKDTIRKNKFPLVQTEVAGELGFNEGYNFLNEEDAIQSAKSTEPLLIYTNSENSIGWIAEHLKFTGLPEKINLFKDKIKFRKMIKPLFPDFYFKEVIVNDLDELNIDHVPIPFVIKPSVGFFSVGVHLVSSRDEWEDTKKTIRADLHAMEDAYPPEVIDTSVFIIEEIVEGDEFAVDAYFDSEGDPVILNIYKHIFSSENDVGDRVYISSKKIIEKNLVRFTQFLKEIGKLAEVRNFPVHAELRESASGVIMPIEINPMRFGGLCTTADMTWFSYGFNPYEYYFYQKRPDWEEILKDKAGKLYNIVVLDNSTGIDVAKITSFNYDRLMKRFENPIELRKLDYKKYSVFGFLFTETKDDNFKELEDILNSDLREYIVVEQIP